MFEYLSQKMEYKILGRMYDESHELLKIIRFVHVQIFQHPTNHLRKLPHQINAIGIQKPTLFQLLLSRKDTTTCQPIITIRHGNRR